MWGVSCTLGLSWWRHQNGNIFRVTGHLCGNSPVAGEFPTQWPVARRFDFFFDVRLIKRLSKQSWGWWSETPSHTLWRQCNGYHKYQFLFCLYTNLSKLWKRNSFTKMPHLHCVNRNGHWCLLQKMMTFHYGDVIMGEIASQITSLTIVYSTVCSDAAQRKHQSSASLAFVQGIHRGPVNSPHKWPVTRKMFPFDDVIM